MTVSSTINKFRYEGNGVTDTFAFAGRIFSAADLKVEIITRATDALVETLTLTTDYSVTILGDESARIEVTNATKIPSSLQDIQIRRDIAKTQTLDLPTGTVFPASSVENALDKITSTLQDLSETVARAVVIPVTSSDTPPDVVELLADAEAAADAAETAQSAAEAAQVIAVAAAAEAEAIVGFDGSADTVVYDNSVSGLSADDVQAAIDEIQGGWLSYASQAEAEAGVAEDKPMNALRTAQAIAEQVVSATTDAEGLVEKATEAEMTAGTEDKFPDAAAIKTYVDAASMTLGTAQATTSGTYVDFTGIPSGVKYIIINFNEVSTSGTNDLLIQLIDSGGAETSGYISTGAEIDGTPSVVSSTSGFIFHGGLADATMNGSIILSLLNNSTFTWTQQHNFTKNDGAIRAGSGAKSLSAELTGVRITTVGGTDTFDAGSVNIQYQ